MGATTTTATGKGATYPSGGTEIGHYSGDNKHLASAPPDYGDSGLGLGLGIDLATGSPSIPLSGSPLGPVLDLSNGEIGIGMKL